jgi:hypothetical protein
MSYRYDSCVLDNSPRPVPDAYVAVLTQPTSSLAPPYAPLAVIYQDSGLTIPLANPFPIASLPGPNAGNGNYWFYTASSGPYTVIEFGGTLFQPIILPDQNLPGGVSSGVLLETNSVPNLSQSTQNLTGGSGVTITNTSGGTVVISSSGAGVSFETNGTPNISQILLNIIAGAGISATADADGDVTLANTSILALETDGTPNSSQSLLNLASLPQSGIILSESGGTVSIFGSPIYDVGSATQMEFPSVVKGHATLGAAGTVTITLPISYTSINSYAVTANINGSTGSALSVTRLSANSFQISGVQGAATVEAVEVESDVLTIVCNNNYQFGDTVTFSAVGAATFLNGETVSITGVNGDTFTAAFTNPDYSGSLGPIADTGTITQILAGTADWICVGN